MRISSGHRIASFDKVEQPHSLLSRRIFSGFTTALPINRVVECRKLPLEAFSTVNASDEASFLDGGSQM